MESVVIRASFFAALLSWCSLPTLAQSASAVHALDPRVFDVQFYRSLYVDTAALDEQQAREHWLTTGLFQGRQGSALLSAPEYLARYSDLAVAFGSQGYAAAIDHFVICGIVEGRRGTISLDPLAFDAGFYVAKNPALGGMSELGLQIHWLGHGIYEGRQASVFLSSQYYLERNPDVMAKVGPDNFYGAIADFVTTGAAQLRPATLASDPVAFDPAFYQALYPDLNGMSPWGLLEHWLLHGIDEGRTASPQLASPEYLERYSDLRQSYGAGNYRGVIDHYVVAGQNERRRGTISLDPDIYDYGAYLAFNPDLAAMSASQAAVHWFRHGIDEGRRASLFFSSRDYLARYPDLAAAYGPTNYRGAIHHYIGAGRRERRQPLAEQRDFADWHSALIDTLSPVAIDAGDRVEEFTAGDGRPVRIVVKAPQASRTSGAVIDLPPLAGGETADEYFASALDLIARERPAYVNIAPGTYRFEFGAGDPEGLVIQGLSDVVIDGNGARLVFTSPMQHVLLAHLQRVVLENFTFDWDIVLAVRGTMSEDGDGRYLQTEALAPGQRINALHSWDTAADRWHMTPTIDWYFDQNGPVVDSTGRIRSQAFPSIPLGSSLLARLPPGRHAVQVLGWDTEDVALDHVDVSNSPYMSFVVDAMRRGFRMTGCRIIRAAGRPISSYADGFHLVAARDVIIEGNELAYQGDDGINIVGSGSYPVNAVIVTTGGTKVVSSRAVDNAGQDHAAGDVIALFNEGLGYLGAASISRVTCTMTYIVASELRAEPCTAWGRYATKGIVQGHSYELELNAPLALQTALTFKNLTRTTARYLIRRNYLHDNRARGILLQAPYGLVTENTIERTTMSGINITTEQFWGEGAGASGLVLSNNLISAVDGSLTTFRRGVIGVGAINIMAVLQVPGVGGGAVSALARYPLHQGILIEKNSVRSVPGPALFASGFEGLIVRANTFAEPNSLAPYISYPPEVPAGVTPTAIFMNGGGLEIGWNAQQGLSAGPFTLVGDTLR